MGSGLELFGLHKDGREFPVEISLSPLQTENGMLVSSAIRDVSERVKSDEIRFRLAAIVDSSTDAIIGETLDGVVTSWNAGAQSLLGYSAEEMLGQPVIRLIPADRHEEERRILARLARGERVKPFETLLRHKDGHDIDVSVTLSPVLDATGRIIGASKVARDITDRKRTEHALERAKEDAENASRELEAFSYSVAHDLRAPLRGIDGFSQALLEDYADKLDAEGKDYLRLSRESAQQMARLIDDLLKLARVTQTELRRERVDLSAMAHDKASQLQTAQPERRVRFEIADGMIAEGDRGLLDIALENLLGNAWKFTRNRDQATISFGRDQQAGREVYVIRDNGAGFNMAYAAKLFGVFQRLHAASEFEGTGIGLATVQRIVRRHGGRIWAEGAVDRGATFFFTLSAEQRP